AAVEVDLAGIQRHCGGEELEGRTHLEHASGNAVQAVLFQRVERIVRIVVRQRGHGDNFAGPRVDDRAGSRHRVIAFQGSLQLVAQDVLGAQVNRKAHRLERVGTGEPQSLEVGQTLVVDVFLDAGDALVVDVHQAQDVRGGRTAWIEAAFISAETKARNAEREDVGRLARRQLPAQPYETGLAVELAV